MREKCSSMESPPPPSDQHYSDSVTTEVKFTDNPNPNQRNQIFLNKDSTVANVEKLIRDIAPVAHPNYELLLQCGDSTVVCLSDSKTSRLCNLVDFTHSKYTLIVSPAAPPSSTAMSLYVNDPSSSSTEDDLLLGASASPTTGELPPTEEVEDGGGGGGTAAPTEPMCIIEATANYVGLVNQAMTCYLNSLVQALYMTPEFRNAIYNWEYDGQNESRSIPYQLQRLFLNLQTSKRAAVETTDLTTSFGWHGSEAWHQHDIQELCRVMFDALERKFKTTKQANLINDLYEGKMLDYVKCLECGVEKSREDTFLDIPLPVRPFGSTVAYNSVEEALRAFVQPETLEGNNQYFCEKCAKKCDAHKGLKFIKFPYLLTLHLKRFDFDYNSMHRIKLNDKVVFPERLNLNSFVPSPPLEERDIVRCDECSTTDSGSALDDESCQGNDLSSTVNLEREDDENCSDEGIDVSSGNVHADNVELPGPYTYELFSIMIHSGSASGGHYYAYIKDFDRNQWLCFNDQSVNRITDEDIKKTYGGGPQKGGYYSGVYSSSTNAYMLMYRQIDPKRNASAMKEEEFPAHVRKLLEEMRSREASDRQHRERTNNSFRFTVYCIHPLTEELMDVRIHMPRDSTLEDAAQMAHLRLKLDGLVDVQDCRMVIYNKKQSCIDFSFDTPPDNLKFCDIVNRFNIMFSDWLLEIKKPCSDWQVYKKGGISMRTYLVNCDGEDVREPCSIRIDADTTVRQLKNKLADLFTPGNNVKLAMTKAASYQEPMFLDDDNALVPFDNISSDFKLYVTSNCEDLDKFKRILEKFEYVIYVNLLLPDADPVNLESLSIPSLDTEILINGTHSPRVSPHHQITDGFDQSNSEDSSLSDSDRTLVGDTVASSIGGIFSSTCTSPTDQQMADPAEDMYNYDVMGNPSEEMNWDSTTPKQYTYFKVTSLTDRRISDDLARLCHVFVDWRMTLDLFKKYLESVVRVPKEYFKIYRSADEEWTQLSDTLRSIKDGQTLTVKLGRALSLNEFCVKIYLLKTKDPNQMFLFEHIVTRGQTAGQIKKECVFKAKKQHMLDLSYSKCRLREKTTTKPKKIFLDDDVIENCNQELYVYEMENADSVSTATQLVLFARKWSPSTLTLHPFEDVVMETTAMADLKQIVSEMSQIPLEFVQVAFVRGSFPFDVNVLDVHTEMDWEPNVTHLDQWPLQVDNGTAFFYRDSREELKELSYDERKDLRIKENTRLGRISSKNCITSEKSLRIYSDNWPSETEDNCID